jgi:hypothetical protein
MRFPRLMLAASGLATVALLGSTAAANASTAAGTVNGPFFNQAEAGYQIQSQVPFNEVRTTIHIPAGSESSPCAILQENVNGGATAAICLINVNGSYELWGTTGAQLNAQTGVPFPDLHAFRAALIPLATLGVPAGGTLFTSQTGGSYYVEAHYSTKRNLVQYVAGPTETDAATLGSAFSFNFSGEFNAPAIETLNFLNIFGGGKFLPISTPQASFTRSGITEPAGHNVGGIAGTRVTFDFFATNEAVATTHGGAPTIGTNPITLEPSPALPGVGSAFGIVTGPAGAGA